MTTTPSSPGPTWRKSSYSDANGEGNCIEIAYPYSWRKSTYSDPSGEGNCVEIAFPGATVAIRDSKNPDGPILTISTATWHTFLTTTTGRVTT
jgi:hypothetical protein